MSKLDFFQPKKLSPADELREIINSLEERQLSVKSMDSTQVLILLRDLDQVYTFFKQAEATDLNLLSEQGRFETVQARLKKAVRPLLRALGGPDALAQHRPTPAPSRQQWWWYINKMVAQQQRSLQRRLLTLAVIVLLLVGGIVLVFNTILAPSPEVVVRIQAENEAYSQLETGNYRAALAIIDAGLAKAPGDSNLMIFKGVLHEALGEEAEAAQIFSQAQAGLENPLTFYFNKGRLELRLNQPDKTEQDARTAIAIDENSTHAWLLLGQALELQDKKLEAISAYEKAGQLGLENGDSQAVVLARMALGRLLSSVP